MRQLSGIDASFLSWEGPTTVGHVTSVIIIDPSTSPEPWTFERYRRHLLSRLDRLGPLTQKLVEVPFGLDRPYWVPDPDFDLDYHLRYVAVPGGGSREHFADLVARIHERPLDRRRPLWECYVVDGVDGDRKAIISKIHHAAIDGLSGQEILAVLVDLDPTTPVPDTPPVKQSADTSAAGTESVEVGDLLAKAAVSLFSSPARLLRAGVTVGRALPVLGVALGRNAPIARGDETTQELLRRFGGAPRTPFNASIGPHRRWSFVSVALDDVKAIKNMAGATVNDVLLAIVGGVLRSWLNDRQELPDRPLAAMVPLSVRQPEDVDAIGNFISSTVATLATHLDEPAERLATIKAGMDAAKAQHEALPAEILTDITQMAPPAVAALAARLVASTKLADRVTLPFNLVVSNVPGPPIPIYLAGALIVGHFPVSAIVDGVGLNVTVMSINGKLDFGFVSDRELIDDLWALADRVPAAVVELANAVGADISITDV
ncbi:MAG: wax ester/triacylglycerol synthase family O-acyltransferase [Actinomycetia bacterium]|nr:wax ester/triacylglycerol synthase family O-acyltransferase [Actinomycetes bacterium]